MTSSFDQPVTSPLRGRGWHKSPRDRVEAAHPAVRRWRADSTVVADARVARAAHRPPSASTIESVRQLSGGEIAGLIAAVALVLLVGFLAVPLLKLGRTLDETSRLVRGVADGTTPLLGEVTTTVTSANHQLARVDAITANAQQVTTNMAALSGIFAATLGGPLVRVAAFSYGVRKALTARRKGEVTKRVRTEMKRSKRGGTA